MAEERGHLKVFVGMAPGVGKTYRMLQEARAEAQGGRDVVIGYLEPQGRQETIAQARGLELLPRRTLTYRGIALEEMDLPAVLARRPELCLIDELAHTNAPGAEHPKRYEDVREVLERGIDVFSTVNIQHLESLNDHVAQLTGMRVRETIPDEVLALADEVVLVDLTPEELIARLREGKVYPPERAQAALEHYFRIENLEALREAALREVADDVEVGRLLRASTAARVRPRGARAEEALALAQDGARVIAERVLALVTLESDFARVLRRAWRSAALQDAELDVLVVRPSGHPTDAEERLRLEELRRLAATLGARLQVREGEDVAAVVVSVARELGTTYVVMGRPGPPRLLERLVGGERSLLVRLLRELPGVDVRIVSDPALREAPLAVAEEGGDSVLDGARPRAGQPEAPPRDAHGGGVA
jgi:two-component system, OmpR family, sensor histidine kinase KdpD